MLTAIPCGLHHLIKDKQMSMGVCVGVESECDRLWYRHLITLQQFRSEEHPAKTNITSHILSSYIGQIGWEIAERKYVSILFSSQKKDVLKHVFII